LTEAHLEHPKETDYRIKCVVPIRKAALNFLLEVILKLDLLGINPAKERCSEL
jgi:hypothetical protein